ncbi:deaminase, partial [Acinetobacter baumannii]
RWERPLKYQFVEHAERNSIFHAAREGSKLAGSTMYCPWYACADCARAIIQAGIKEVVGHQKCFDLTPGHWKESIANAFQMFEEAGVKTRTIS